MKEPVIIHLKKTSEEDLKKRNKELPTDIHLVRYRKPTWKKKETVAGIRAYKKSDIFDHLHDQGYVVLEITSGFGSVKPKLFGVQQV